MKRLPNRYLVMIKDPESPGVALERAKQLAPPTSSELHLLLCGRRFKGERETAEACLEALASDCRDQGINTSIAVRIGSGIFDAVMAELKCKPCGLVIKECGRKPDGWRRTLSRSSDWQLLRNCPALVMLVHPETRWENQRVLAAVDADASGEIAQSLNKLILMGADVAARVGQAELNLVSAYPSPLQAASERYLKSRDAMAARYRQQLLPLQEKYQIDDAHLHIDEGPADLLIIKKAEALKASLVVLGTVARAGVSGALLGNTAEQVLGKLSADVLAVRPLDNIEALNKI